MFTKKILHQQSSQNIFHVFTILACSILLLYRSFFSFTWSDESFYLTIVHRLWLGEIMFVDEWYTTQLSAPLLLPFYSFFQRITQGSDGVYLYFRFLYWLLSSISTFFIYFKIKKWNSSITALFCSLIYMFYSRANIFGLSYYNTTLTFVLLGVVFIYHNCMLQRPRFFDLYITGIFFALAVVITPYLSIAYIGISLFFLIYKKTRIYWKALFNVVLGTGTTALLYLSYVFNKVSLSDIISNIPHVLNEPELQKTNPLLAFPLIFLRIAWRYKWTILPYILLLFYILYKHKKNSSFSAKNRKVIILINLLIFTVNFFLSSNLLGCVNIALALYGLIILVYKNSLTSSLKSILNTFYLSGFCVVLTFTFSSDTGLDAMAIGFVFLSIGTILCLFQNINKTESQQEYFLIKVVIISVILQTAFLRIFSVYRDAPLNQLSTQISSGPAKYLYTTPEHEKQYTDLENDINLYVRDNDKVFYTVNCFWAYLCTKNEYGTPSSWRVGMNSPRLTEYFSINPKKIPTCIFVLRPEYGNFESSFIQGNEKTERPNENKLKGFLYDYIKMNNYETIEAKSSIIFRKRN